MLRLHRKLRAWLRCWLQHQILLVTQAHSLTPCGGSVHAGVSANSVTVNDIQNGGITVPGTSSSNGGGGGLSTGAIVGIVIGALAGLLLLRKH